MSTIDIIQVPTVKASDAAVADAARADIKAIEGRCALITRVCNERTQALGVAAAQDARLMIKRIEDCRVRVKDAPWNLCKQIDALARSLSTKLEEDVKRIDGLLTGYVREQDRIKREAERLRLQAEADAKAAAAAEAERIRKAAEVAAAATVDPVKAQQTIDMASAQAKQVVAAAATPQQLPFGGSAPTKVHGMQSRRRWTYKVKDLLVLANHDKNLVRIEAAAGAIMEKINGGMRECPGLEIFEELNANTTTR